MTAEFRPRLLRFRPGNRQGSICCSDRGVTILVAPPRAAGSPRKGREIISLLLDLASRDRARTPGSRPNPNIRDSKHDSDAIGWAAFFTRPEIVQILGDHATNAPDSSGY